MQPYTSIYQRVTAGVNSKELAGADGDINMEDDAVLHHTKEVYCTVAAAVTPERSFKHQKGACWYIDMEDDVVDTTEEA